MIEDGIGEITGVMTILTGIAALDMVGRFTRRGGAVVTADTGALNLIVINLCDGRPIARYMAGFTDVAGGDVIAIFTRCRAAIMTGDTVAGDATMIEGGIGKIGGVVAVLTGIAALDMIGRFTRCGGAVVTADATALNFGVIHLTDRVPVARCMAGFTDVTGADVIGRFAGCIGAVMTTDTVSGDATVIKGRTGEGAGIVAILTGIAALDMIG